IARQPRSTLFPYTTLFRSTDPKAQCKFDLALKKLGAGNYRIRHMAHPNGKVDDPYIPTCKEVALKTDKVTASELAKNETLGDPRSEEHTSELQSLAYLVCR